MHFAATILATGGMSLPDFKQFGLEILLNRKSIFPGQNRKSK
jgi:hypothetical protein